MSNLAQIQRKITMKGEGKKLRRKSSSQIQDRKGKNKGAQVDKNEEVKGKGHRIRQELTEETED